jgi:CheY-like chemotaxis protein
VSPRAAHRLTGIKVLLVDDEPDSLAAICMLLEVHGADVVAVLSAVQARDALRSFAADVLVSDISMPGEDGCALVASVRTMSRGGAACPVALALSALAGPEDRARALAAGFSRYLTKPVDPQVLLRTVAELAPA